MSRREDPSTEPADFESHQERVVRHGKERIRIAVAYLTEEMSEAEPADAVAWVATEEEAIHARILKTRQLRNMRALAREHNRTVHEMVGLSPKEGEEVSGGEDSSGDDQIRLDPYCVFDRYFRDKDDKGAEKDKDNHG
ncbi:Phytosulfokines 5 [Hordeum vulgare]|nr:Phytosulfokines 5 [Hordeum vulgare]